MGLVTRNGVIKCGNWTTKNEQQTTCKWRLYWGHMRKLSILSIMDELLRINCLHWNSQFVAPNPIFRHTTRVTFMVIEQDHSVSFPSSGTRFIQMNHTCKALNQMLQTLGHFTQLWVIFFHGNSKLRHHLRAQIWRAPASLPPPSPHIRADLDSHWAWGLGTQIAMQVFWMDNWQNTSKYYLYKS